MRSRVEELFEKKSAPWGEKYAPGRPLHYRLALFTSAVERLQAAPSALLDFGCGTGNLAAHLAQLGWTVSACDISQGMIEQASRAFAATPISWTKLDAEWQALPYDTGKFGLVVSSSVLEYVPDAGHVFSEVSRILRPRGGFIATVPNVTHRIRKVEGLLQTLLPRASLRFRIPHISPSVTKMVERSTNYVRFLETSRGRYPLSYWKQLAMAAGLELEFTEANNTPLTLLAFRKRA